ncbi:MAG: F0F1 ATP synthase subunit delta [Clostridiales bacterium]|jgi:F0F1-type ATP synthase delta subunit|nr:F0F1 ATP synthase subunit delta [Clostridiales bacterium]
MVKKHLIKIVVSQEIGSTLQKKVEAFLQKKHAGVELDFEYEVDSSILGGLLIIDGDQYYDGTLKNQLIKVRKSFK